MKLILLLLCLTLFVRPNKYLYYNFITIETPLKEQIIILDQNNTPLIKVNKSENILITFEPLQYFYGLGNDLFFIVNDAEIGKFKYVIQRDGLSLSLFIYDINETINKIKYFVRPLQGKFFFEFNIEILPKQSNDPNELIILGSTGIKYYGDRVFVEVFCYLKTTHLIQNKDFVFKVYEKNKLMRDVLAVPNKNGETSYMYIKMEITKILNHTTDYHFNCKHSHVRGKEILNVNININDLNIDNNKIEGKMKPHEMGLSIIFGILIMILFFFRFGLPIYQIIKKQFKEQDEAENAKITSIFENIDIEEEIKKSYLDYKKQINEGEKMKLKNECKHTVTINIKHFDLEFDKYFIKKVIVIDNFDLYASTEIFNICINEKIDGIITLTPSFNYANAEHEDDHFHEYAPGYYPEIFNIHVIGLKEKQCTQYPGIHLRDYEVKDIEIAKTFTDGYSIVQVCVSNWNLNNNFPTPYYISHILNIIETVELENIIIHGTRLGKRAKILGAVIYLIHNLINIALEDVDIDFSVITKFINQYENLSCGGELNENEFNITIVSLIGHLLRKGYIRSKAIESKLNNFFKKINS